MKFCFKVVLTLALTGVVHARTIYVDAVNGNDAWSGLCQTDEGGGCGPKRTLPAGLAVTLSGDIVEVAKGDYRVDDILMDSRSLTLRGVPVGVPRLYRESFGGNLHLRNHDYQIHGLTFDGVSLDIGRDSAGAAAFIVSDCRFVNGPGLQVGGNVSVTGPITVQVDHCVFERQDSANAWGIRVELHGVTPFNASITNCQFLRLTDSAIHFGSSIAAATISNCIFDRNFSHGTGAGIYGYINGAITGCTFDRNHAVIDGGALNLTGGVQIQDCRFERNSSNRFGGAVQINGGQISNCTFIENSAESGGALAGPFASLGYVFPVRDSAFFNNRSTRNGGAYYFSQSGGGLGTRFENCTFVGNEAVGLGGGVCWESTSELEVASSVFRGNIDTFGMDAFAQITEWDALSLTFSNVLDVADLSADETNIDADPLFADASQGDFHLLPGSPCIDTGESLRRRRWPYRHRRRTARHGRPNRHGRRRIHRPEPLSPAT